MAAENQDQSEVAATKYAANLQNGPESGSVDQFKELYSLKNDQTPKVRKPYTIMKQREKWTEEDHQKFLEALKLYGRGWRQIEEHVGTKTAVQIRSHAQKFFYKVVRDSNGGSESCAKPIEIPPPRPKRKPMHPYPRKLAEPVKGGSTPTQTESSNSPTESIGEQDNKSPTSVLSPFASDMVSPVSEQQNGCSSPTSCTTNMHSTNASPVGKVNENVTSKATLGEEKASLSAILVSTPQLNDFSSIKLDAGFKDNVCGNGDEAEVSASTSIKLFGRTVLVDSCNHFPGMEIPKLSISRNRHENTEGDNETVVTSTSKLVDTDLSLGMFTGDCITAARGTVHPYVKNFTGKSDSLEPVSDATRPWWVIYNGLPYYLSPVDPNTAHAPESCCNEERMKKEIPTERSCTGSNAGSVTRTENRERNSDSVDSQCQSPLLEAALDSRRRNGKGFVPYKRCLAERDVLSSVVAAEEQERQRTRIC